MRPFQGVLIMLVRERYGAARFALVSTYGARAVGARVLMPPFLEGAKVVR